MDAGLHYGHLIKLLNPHMSPYILGSRGGIHIINLDKTLPMLRQACLALRDLARRGAKVVFVGTKPLAQRLTYECAMACEQYRLHLLPLRRERRIKVPPPASRTVGCRA